MDLKPEVASGVYSNFVLISHSPSDFILDFARILPGMPKPEVASRIIMAPEHAKRLLMALQENIFKYEQEFGKIQLPHEGSRTIAPFNVGRERRGIKGKKLVGSVGSIRSVGPVRPVRLVRPVRPVRLFSLPLTIHCYFLFNHIKFLKKSYNQEKCKKSDETQCQFRNFRLSLHHGSSPHTLTSMFSCSRQPLTRRGQAS